VSKLKAIEHITACGHVNIRSTNKTTFEITKETHLTPRGDCIIAVSATKGAVDLSPEFKKIACKQSVHIEIRIKVDGEEVTVKAQGHPALTFSHATDLVVRKSDYVCGRTLAIRADKAAYDFPRRLVEKLRNPNQKAKITLTAETATT
jgi:hypothetical protein